MVQQFLACQSVAFEFALVAFLTSAITHRRSFLAAASGQVKRERFDATRGFPGEGPARQLAQATRILTANVTGLGSLLAGIEAGAYQEVGILLVQEHHQPAEAIQRVRLRLRALGWQAAVGAALRTSAGGTSGGVAVLWRPYLSWVRVPAECVPGRAMWGLLQHHELGPLAVGTAYLPVQTELGLGEDQQAVLTVLLDQMRDTGRPALCGGDYNAPPHVLAEWLAPRYPHLQVMYTGVPTCLSAQPRELDYFVMSPTVTQSVAIPGIEHHPEGGLTPHVAVGIRLDLARMRAQVKQWMPGECGTSDAVIGPQPLPPDWS